MKRIMITIASILIIGMVSVVSATAEPITKRLDRQKMRIHQGVDSGALTGKEWHRLMNQHRKIRRLHRKAWHDGHLSSRERRHLHSWLDRASRRIHRLKHNEIYAQIDDRSKRHHPRRLGPRAKYEHNEGWGR